MEIRPAGTSRELVERLEKRLKQGYFSINEKELSFKIVEKARKCTFVANLGI